jgi:transcription elongation factor GreA
MKVNVQKTIPFTADAYAQNESEFARLTQLRKEVMERLIVAREMGDLSENGAYTAAKFELGNIGRQLRYLKHVLMYGYVAQTTTATDVADFGKTITLKNDSEEFTFMLVSEHESNLAENKLSLKSPIGQAAKGKKVGDRVEVTTPKGTVNYTLIKIT